MPSLGVFLPGLGPVGASVLIGLFQKGCATRNVLLCDDMKLADRGVSGADRRTVRPREKTKDEVYGAAHSTWALEVKKRAGWRCQACGARGVRLIADHIIEIQDGGDPLDLKNGQAFCDPCHGKKSAAARSLRAAQSLVKP